LSTRSIAPALALGNVVLLTPDQRTTVCGGVLLARILAEVGVPAGVFQLLPGGVEIGAALVREPRVRVVAFTGSTRAGQLIAAEAAQTFTRTHLELGGNSPLVVLADADVEQAVALGAFGSFSNFGQVCMAVGRHLVHEALYGEYVARLAATAEALTVGDGWRADVALGPLIDDRQAALVADLVARSVGARVVAGGTREGWFFRPTVLADCTPQMPAYTEEVFGPVACVRRFATVDEAISMARDSNAGLSLGIVTNDMAAAMRIADEVPSGAVRVNDTPSTTSPTRHSAGLGASGYSRVGGVRANTESFTETRWMTLRTVPAPRPLLGRHDLGDPDIRQYKSIS
jgi:benzaldehyde dehydrogenase (NAD)